LRIGHGRLGGQRLDQAFRLEIERHHLAGAVARVDELQHSDDVAPWFLQRHYQHRAGSVTKRRVESSVEDVRLPVRHAIRVGEVEQPSGEGHVTRQARLREIEGLGGAAPPQLVLPQAPHQDVVLRHREAQQVGRRAGTTSLPRRW